jgi:hypothetical protein
MVSGMAVRRLPRCARSLRLPGFKEETVRFASRTVTI